MAFDFDAAERFLLNGAPDALPALTVARQATMALVAEIEGTHIPAVSEEEATPSYYVGSATLVLATMAFRTARAALLVISAGYWPESHGLKRRLSEVHARAQAVAQDTSGQHARDWLDGKSPSTARKLFNKYGSADLWDIYSWGSHAEVQSVHQWLSQPAGKVTHGLNVPPAHDERLSNALLVECAMECRDLAFAQGVTKAFANGNGDDAARTMRTRLSPLDAVIKPLQTRYYAPEE